MNYNLKEKIENYFKIDSYKDIKDYDTYLNFIDKQDKELINYIENFNKKFLTFLFPDIDPKLLKLEYNSEELKIMTNISKQIISFNYKMNDGKNHIWFDSVNQMDTSLLLQYSEGLNLFQQGINKFITSDNFNQYIDDFKLIAENNTYWKNFLSLNKKRVLMHAKQRDNLIEIEKIISTKNHEQITNKEDLEKFIQLYFNKKSRKMKDLIAYRYDLFNDGVQFKRNSYAVQEHDNTLYFYFNNDEVDLKDFIYLVNNIVFFEGDAIRDLSDLPEIKKNMSNKESTVYSFEDWIESLKEYFKKNSIAKF